MIKAIIAGSRRFEDFRYANSVFMNHLLYNSIRPSDVEIISGGARGADRIGEMIAEAHGIKLVRFPADWTTYGKSAGMIRNNQMADYAVSGSDEAILFAFWDGKSRGTKGMIDIAKRKGMSVVVSNF